MSTENPIWMPRCPQLGTWGKWLTPWSNIWFSNGKERHKKRYSSIRSTGSSSKLTQLNFNRGSWKRSWNRTSSRKINAGTEVPPSRSRLMTSTLSGWRKSKRRRSDYKKSGRGRCRMKHFVKLTSTCRRGTSKSSGFKRQKLRTCSWSKVLLWMLEHIIVILAKPRCNSTIEIFNKH